MGELHCEYCHVSPYDKDCKGNKELPCDHFWEITHRTHNPGIPQTQDVLQSHPQSSHILAHKDSDYKDSHPYILMTVLMTLNFRIPYISSYSLLGIEDNVLRIGDCDPFDEMSSHDDYPQP